MANAGIGCERCAPFGGRGYRLETDRDRTDPHSHVVVCECVAPHCVCGALQPLRRLAAEAVPAYGDLAARADEAMDEQKCPCWQVRRHAERLDHLLRLAQVPELYEGKLMGDYRIAHQGAAIPGAELALAQAQTWVEKIVSGDEVRSLYLSGPPGSGKTLLASIALTELILHTARPGLFVKLSLGYFQRLRATYDDQPGGERASQVIARLSAVPHLVLDDLGAERGSAWEIEWLYNLIDARYQKRRPVIITSNHSIEDLRELSRGRVASRLRHMSLAVKTPERDLRELFSYGQ